MQKPASSGRNSAMEFGWSKPLNPKRPSQPCNLHWLRFGSGDLKPIESPAECFRAATKSKLTSRRCYVMHAAKRENTGNPGTINPEKMPWLRKKRGLNMFGQGQAFVFLPALSPKQVCPLPRPEPAKSCSKAEQTVHWGLRTSKLGTKGISAARKQRQEHVLPHCRCPLAFHLRSSPTFHQSLG